jgi:serine/threonine-protein kinase
VIGKTLAHYKIIEKIGAGGMGEVYRARDAKLGREVALKILPQAFAQDADRMVRFQREAQVLASLNHPNIAAIYGFEAVDSFRSLVLELVEGPTLADRIRSGPLALDETVSIARQIAEALEAAHEKGIIHRDLKPANVKLSEDDRVKVLDFGLAKALEDSPGVDSAASAESPTISPAISAQLTGRNVLLGTAAYMSPEQARGKPVDRRCDIWSFGAVLFEMLTGRQLFSGETVSDTLAAVLRKEPNWDELPRDTPFQVRRLLRRCLERDPKRRLRDIGEARVRLERWSRDPSSMSEGDHVGTPSRGRAWTPWIVALVAAVAAVLGWARRGGEGSANALPITRVSIRLPAGREVLGGWTVQSLDISSDGRQVIYKGVADGFDGILYRRSLDTDDAQPIEGTEGALAAFFSPDGRSICFGARGALKVISSSGGSAVELTPISEVVNGGCWLPDDTIVFVSGFSAGLARISAQGGEVEMLTEPDRERGEISHRFPFPLPGGRAVLFTIKNDRILDFSDATIAVVSLDTGEVRRLVDGGTDPAWLPTGHLAYHHGGSLMAVPFDAERLEVTGPPIALVDDVAYDPAAGGALWAFSPEGTMVWVRGGSTRREESLVWCDEEGRVVGTTGPPASYMNARLSPDGRRIVTPLPQANNKLWLLDRERDILTRLTFGPGNDFGPIWSPQGDWVYFNSDRGGLPALFRVRVGDSSEEAVAPSDSYQEPCAVSQDGALLVYAQEDDETGLDLWTVRVEEDASPEPFLRTPFDEYRAAFGPDDHWLLYCSDESGDHDLYLRRFPDASGKIQVTSGGQSGRPFGWHRNGREIVYHDGSRWLRVPVEMGPRPRIGKPSPIFADSVAIDPVDFPAEGPGFLARDPKSADVVRVRLSDHIEVVFNWFEDVRRRVR